MPRLSLFALALAALALTSCDSSEPEGPLADVAPGEWTFVEVEGSVCRDGSPTGIGVRLQEDSDDLMIYLEGGGACFNGATCSTNPSSFGATDFAGLVAQAGEAGVFSTSAANPVGDWNVVYVPYCTGDVHAGSFPNNTLLQAAGVDGTQQFVGHQNVKRALALLEDGLGTQSRVLLAGSSAGGLGTLFNFDAVAQTFDDADLFLVDDSGPLFFADNVLSPQLVTQVVTLYNGSAALPSAPQLFQPDALPGVYDYYATRYPDATFGLASHLGDDVFQQFYGFGQAPGDPITDEEFAAGLRDVRAQLPESWGTFFAEGDAHTFLRARYTLVSAGVSFDAWLAGLLAGTPTDVDPGTARLVAAR
ncbi:pectin acetylesterase-family hydrolase [Rubrivirga marina]|uniref:Pectinacetylesterase n=1 Tax=Rubrivirga marina TaxID=1196024 RepID=A0A271IZC1_9BACT|nr:pectin acetylesterase-family hydrolase [Rubrivirga marina]PAP76164.1 hypothetical protein BSZ37_06740 [Rubrivirga marina]